MKLKLHFQIFPPKIYANTNQEQDFYAIIDDNQWKKMTEGTVLTEINTALGSQQEMMAISFNVRANQARINNQLSSYLVPVMLHSEGGSIQITAYRQVEKSHHTETGLTGDCAEEWSPIWIKLLSYELPENYFPKVQMSSRWKQIDEKTASCQIGIDEMIIEEWSQIGPIHHYIRFSHDYSIALDLGIQVAVNSQTLEPMTYYIDRIYSLKTIGLYLNPVLLRHVHIDPLSFECSTKG